MIPNKLFRVFSSTVIRRKICRRGLLVSGPLGLYSCTIAFEDIVFIVHRLADSLQEWIWWKSFSELCWALFSRCAIPECITPPRWHSGHSIPLPSAGLLVHLKGKEWKYTDRLGCMLKNLQVVRIGPELLPLRCTSSSLHWCSFWDVNLVIFKYMKFIDRMFVARVRRCTGCYLMQRPMYPQNWLFDNMATAVWPARMWNHSPCFPECHAFFFHLDVCPGMLEPTWCLLWCQWDACLFVASLLVYCPQMLAHHTAKYNFTLLPLHLRPPATKLCFG